MIMESEIGNFLNSCITGGIAVDSEIDNFLNNCLTGG
jgi:hypothetical protein